MGRRSLKIIHLAQTAKSVTFINTEQIRFSYKSREMLFRNLPGLAKYIPK